MMPIISMFFGIVVRMYADDHNPPHVHVEYQGNKAVYRWMANCFQAGYPRNSIGCLSHCARW